MIWKSLGIIFNPKSIKSIKSHSWVPTVIKYKRDEARVFFAGRDKFNHSSIYAFNISLKKPYKILKKTTKPVLSKGDLGFFDDSAAIPSHIIKIKNKYFLYYIGWTQGITVPYISSIGLATSKSLFSNFTKFKKSPIIGRTEEDPIFVASCFVQKKGNKFEMIYTSNTSWKKKGKKLIPRYFLKLASSKNGIDWKFKKKIMKFKSKNEVAISRPWIIKHKNKEYIFYSYRTKNYKIGFAKFNKKKQLVRYDSLLKIQNNIDKFDNKMQEYSSVIDYGNKYLMFYNGNNFGEKGIGLAEINKKDLTI